MEKIPNMGNIPAGQDDLKDFEEPTAPTVDQDPQNEISSQIIALEKELKMLTEWSRVDSHPDDYKRISAIKDQIRKLEISKYKQGETLNEVIVDESVDILKVKEEITQNESLTNLYNQAKRNLSKKSQISQGPVKLKRSDVIKEMFRIMDEELEPWRVNTMRADLEAIIERNRKS